MNTVKVSVSIDTDQLKKIDGYVKRNIFKSRSHAFQMALANTLKCLAQSRLARECAKLDIQAEQEMAD